MEGFNVEILGREVSIWGGIDGHYVGTRIVGHKLCNIMELSGDFTVFVRTTFSGKTYVVIKGDKFVVDPITRNFGINVPFSQYDVTLNIMGGDKVGERFDEYFRICTDLDLNGMPLQAFKEILKSI